MIASGVGEYVRRDVTARSLIGWLGNLFLLVCSLRLCFSEMSFIERERKKSACLMIHNSSTSDDEVVV